MVLRNGNDVVDEFADMTPSWTSHEGELYFHVRKIFFPKMTCLAPALFNAHMYESSFCLSILVIAVDFCVAINSNLILQICSASMTCPRESIAKLRHCVHRKQRGGFSLKMSN